MPVTIQTRKLIVRRPGRPQQADTVIPISVARGSRDLIRRVVAILRGLARGYGVSPLSLDWHLTEPV